MRIRFTYAAFLFFATCAHIFPQAAVSSAELKGRISDQTGAPLPGVAVTINDPERGITRSALTDERGEYSFALVQPGSYDIKAELSGFSTQIKKGVQLRVGETAVVDFQMMVSEITAEVVVFAETPLIEVEKTQQSNTIQERQIRDLPINRRDYLSFTLLAPGVTDANALADNTDFRVAQTPHTGLSFYGSNGRGNSITIDGAENNYFSGGVRPTMSQEAIREFQINRSNYSAEFGGASGGVINIVSKTGTNQLRGSIFGFFRDDSLDARDPFAIGNGGVPVDPPFSRQQYGGSIGFPIRRDKTFFFGAFEKLNRDESASVPILTDFSIFDPTPSQSQMIDFLGGVPIPALQQLAAGLRGALTSPLSTRRLFEENSGVFPFTANFTTFSARIDHNGQRDQLAFRISYTNSFTANTNLRALVGFSRGNAIDNLDGSAFLSETHIFSNNSVNEFKFQWSYDNNFVLPNDPLGPEINIPGFGFFGRDIFLPAFSIERRYQWLDNFMYTRGNHRFKAGVDINVIDGYSNSHTFLPGRFSFGEVPQLNLGFLMNLATQNPNFAAALADALGRPAGSPPPAQGALPGLGRPDLIPNISAPLTALQNFNLGLPTFYQQGFGDPTWHGTPARYAFYAQDTWKAARNLTLNLGLRYELEVEPEPLNTDKNNFGPRFGFSWDPFKDKKTVVRGGYGIYYSPVYFQIHYVVNALAVRNGFYQIAQVFVPLSGVPGIINPRTGQLLTSADIFQTLRAQRIIGARQITQDDLRQFGITIRHTLPLPPLSVTFRDDPKYANAYTQQSSFGIERQIAHNLSVSADYIFVRGAKITRARDDNLLEGPIHPVLGVRTFAFKNPLLLQDNIYESSANTFYHGFTLSINKRYSNNFMVNANYTLSKAIDEVTDFNSDFQPNDQLDLRAERALSAFDQRHRLIFTAIIDSPWRGGQGAHPLERILANWTLAPILSVSSARPFNLLVGSDINGDRHSTTDRPPFAGRNTGIGPDFWTFDLRVMRRVKFGEERSLELIFEAFNLFNRLNFASVNNTVGLLPPPYSVKGRKDRRPSQPLGFTSAFDPRQIQLGFRFNF